jgi:hypothetical protein
VDLYYRANFYYSNELFAISTLYAFMERLQGKTNKTLLYIARIRAWRQFMYFKKWLESVSARLSKHASAVVAKIIFQSE